MNPLYDISLTRIDGSHTTLAEFRNKLLLIVAKDHSAQHLVF